MRYLTYAFLGLVSLGLIGSVVAVAALIGILSYYGKDLPDVETLKSHKSAQVTRLYAGDGRLLSEYAEEKRVYVPIEAVPDAVKNAFIAAEDQNFYAHGGVDYVAILRAVVTNVKNYAGNRRPVGASTITQQVAKNFFLTNEVSYVRKIKEAILAQRIERALSKNDILELYLNEIYLGGGAYGVAAAAQSYFDKPLEALNLPEAAYLAALPKAPNNYNPDRYYDAAIERRNWVLGRMRKDGFITKEEYLAAKDEDLVTIEQDEADIVRAPYFAEEVRRELEGALGAQVLYRGGLVVRTSVSPFLQSIATKSLREGLLSYDKRHGWRGPIATLESTDNWRERLAKVEPPDGLIDGWTTAVILNVSGVGAVAGLSGGDKVELLYESAAKWTGKGSMSFLKPGDVVVLEKRSNDEGTSWHLQQIPAVQGGLIAMDPHTGRVLAMQGGWKYGTDQFNRATQAWRQPGSAFKPIIYLTALTEGFTPATLILDAPFEKEDRPGHIWRPKNYTNEFYGPTPLRAGIEKSRNLMTVRLADYIGMEKVGQMAETFGVVDSFPRHLANSLGSAETTLLRMTNAYAQLVNGGKKIEPIFIDRIQDRDGRTIFTHDRRPCEGCGPMVKWNDQSVPYVSDERPQIVDPRAAYQMVSIMEGVVQRGTATRLASLNRPLAGKTGTTNDSKDTWFIGFTPDLVVGVYIGYDDPKPMGKGETGSSVSAPVFKDFMEQALADTPATPFRVPPGISKVQINLRDGTLAEPGDDRVIWESFIAGTEPEEGAVYMLGTSGIIRRVGSYGYYNDFYGNAPPDYSAYGTEYQDAYGSGVGVQAPQPDRNQRNQSAITGTGGLY